VNVNELVIMKPVILCLFIYNIFFSFFFVYLVKQFCQRLNLQIIIIIEIKF